MARSRRVLFSAVSSQFPYWFSDFYWSLFQVLFSVENLVTYGRECRAIAWVSTLTSFPLLLTHTQLPHLSFLKEKEDIGLEPRTEDPLYSPVYSARRPDPPPPTPLPPQPPRMPSRDLSNMKLAQNQTELSRQIEDLAATVEIQGRMLQRLMEVLEENTRKTSYTDR